jgi:hypothetical protein
MYWTETDPETGRKIYVEKDPLKKQKQKELVTPECRRSATGKRYKRKKV